MNGNQGPHINSNGSSHGNSNGNNNGKGNNNNENDEDQTTPTKEESIATTNTANTTNLPLTNNDTFNINNTDDETAFLASRARLAHTTAVPENVRRKNKRKRYLELHPEYFGGSHLELADPLLYDRLIRRFQSTSERESEGRKKGYSGVLEADLVRSEAKIAALQHPDPNSDIQYRRGQNGEILAEERDEIPASKEEGYERWKYVMERRFIEGRDQDFDYKTIDESDDLDGGEQEQERQDQWFDDQIPEWVDDEEDFKNDDDRHNEEIEVSHPERELKGQTGVQDF